MKGRTGWIPRAALPIVAIAVAMAALPPTAAAQDEPVHLHPEARDAIAGLWSPYCPGMMLAVCTSGAGAALRDSIQVMAEDGMTSEAIIEDVLSRHGEEYRAEPKAEGVGRLAWWMPWVGLGAGVLLAGSVLVRARGRREPIGPVSEPTPEDDARLREALKELDALEAPDY